MINIHHCCMSILYKPQNTPPNLKYKPHSSRPCNCWSLRCSWSIACRCCSNYIFILDWTLGFNGLGKGNCSTRRETFNFLNCVRLILQVWPYITKALYHPSTTYRARNQSPCSLVRLHSISVSGKDISIGGTGPLIVLRQNNEFTGILCHRPLLP